jgi:glutaconate CoA-transferase, subunit B
MSDESYAPAELMAAVLSRELCDDDFGAVGAAAQIPMCAMRLAQRTHAPNLWTLYGGSGAVNSKLPGLLESAADYRNLTGAEYRAPLNDIIDYEFTGRFTVCFLGGMQVDQYGAMNMVCIGDYARPRVRGPGTVGLAFTAAFQRVVIYVQHHNPRIFVPRVDFVSGPGHRDADALAAYRLPWAQGPVLVVTPLAVLDFATPDRRLRLRSVHPGHIADEVAAQTGFPLAMPDPVPTTEPPTPEQLRIIREELDPDGVLRRLIP